MANKKTTEHAAEVIKDIMAKVNKGVIKDYEMPSICNMKTGETVGFAVRIQLGTKFDYTNAILDDWMKQLCADEYMISVKRTQLWVQFKVRFDMEGDQ